jgi:hypothetical protein
MSCIKLCATQPEYHNYSNFSTIDAKHPFFVNLIKVRKNKMVTEAGKKNPHKKRQPTGEPLQS